MRLSDLISEIGILAPPGDLPVKVDGDPRVEVSVVHPESGEDYLNIGVKGGETNGD